MPAPSHSLVIRLKWVYKIKLDEYGEVLKNKAWLVAKGYRQETGIDFEESFAPMILFLPPQILRLQVSQNPRGIFNNQSKYALEILKKYGLDSSASVNTPMVEKMKLDEDRKGKLVDPTHFRGMVGSLLYLSASRPDIVFAVCMHARYQAKPTKKHLYTIKRIFRYLKGTIHMGLWYLKDSGFALRDLADADYTEQVENMVVEVYFVETKYQLANIFTKALQRERFKLILPLLGMKQLSPETLRELQESANE
ncbi:retrovirus-related pol polyprotein from transposon TNT 1-94 [Tanacetum coccineum]